MMSDELKAGVGFWVLGKTAQHLEPNTHSSFRIHHSSFNLMSNGITRRELLGLALVSPLAAACSSVARARDASVNGLDSQTVAGLDRRAVINAPGRVVGVGDDAGAAQVKLIREWRGPVCRSRMVNRGRAGVRLKEVVLFDIAHRLP